MLGGEFGVFSCGPVVASPGERVVSVAFGAFGPLLGFLGVGPGRQCLLFGLFHLREGLVLGRGETLGHVGEGRA